MQLHPYLNFDGQCAEAFRTYERVLGGTLTMQTHGESPMKEHTPPAWHDMVLHAHLQVDDAVIMGSDAPPEHYQKPGGSYVSIHVEDPAEADRIFTALSEGGAVQMPLQETFWAKRFGMWTDRFGINWMVNCA